MQIPRSSIPLFLLVALALAHPSQAGESNARYFLNPIYPNWTCINDTQPYCYGNSPRNYAFSTIYPSDSTGNNILYVINEWAATGGAPGSGTPGDSPMLWYAPDTRDGARGASPPVYFGDLSPALGPDDHWGGYPLVQMAWNDWIFLVEYAPGDDTSTLYYRRGNPFDFVGPLNDGNPGPPASAFHAGNTVWKISDPCGMRLSGMTYIKDPLGGDKLRGFVTWNRRQPAKDGTCMLGVQFMETDPLVIDFATQTYTIAGITKPFGSEFPASLPGAYKRSWDLTETPWGTFAFRTLPIGGMGSVSNPPPACPNPSGFYQQNLNALLNGVPGGRKLGLETWQWAPVDVVAGTVTGPWTSGSGPYTPAHHNTSIDFAAGGSYSHGTYQYRTTGDAGICYDTLITWNRQSGNGVLVHDWTP